MAQITVNTAALKAKAGEFRNLNSQLKTKIGDMTSTENSLNSMWEGDSKNAFHQAFQSDINQMNNFYNAIEKYVTALEEIASKWGAAEAKNQSIGTNRTY